MSRGFWLKACAVAGTYWVWRSFSKNRLSYSGKVVLLTGGSRGFGLILARLLAQQGAKLVLVSRTEEDLKRAQSELRQIHPDVEIHVADLRDPEQIKNAVQFTVERFGHIDVVLHNAGVITSGPFVLMTREDFEKEMDIHFWAALNLVQETLPIMRSQGEGQIINISSIGGHVPVPHLSPYCASKYALTGLSETLHAELARYGIKVTTVCPGTMRTGSIYQAEYKGDAEIEKTWFSLMASLPVLSARPETVAKRVLEAASKGEAWVAPSLVAKLGIPAHALFPNLWAQAMRVMNRPLPDQGSRQAVRGTEVHDKLPGFIKKLSRDAAQRNNELPP